VNINDKNKYGNTALMYAASNNRETIISLLINRGADVNCKDNHRMTAFDYAEELLRINPNISLIIQQVNNYLFYFNIYLLLLLHYAR
jgi:ankyrin repeat protein